MARYLEEAGFSTVTLTMTPEFNRLVGMPRVAGIEYPFGRPIGNADDREGQRAVLLAALSVFEKASGPGVIFPLPFTWPEDPRKVDWQPPEPSPIIKLFMGDIKKARREEAKK